MTENLRIPLTSRTGLVTDALQDRIDPRNPPMLIGAEARDILHAELGHTFANRATQYVDLAFAVPDWTAYSQLVEGLDAIPDTGIAFRVAGVHVDFLAFGPIESPAGTLVPPFRRSDPLDVFGMAEVYESARDALVGDALRIRVPTVAGYVALKIKAWIDRSVNHELKDAPDLGLALYWAAESVPFTERFWVDHELVGLCEADVGLGGARLLGRDVRKALGHNANTLAELFTEASRGRLARTLEGASPSLVLGDTDRRRSRLDALALGLRG